jgi:hypothetical protein
MAKCFCKRRLRCHSNPPDTATFEPSEAAIAEFFDAQKEKYKTEPMLKASYVVFDPGRL